LAPTFFSEFQKKEGKEGKELKPAIFYGSLE
jgi:hypothetical protein